MKFSNTHRLRDKDVVNVCDGSRLGCPSDFEFETCTGKIVALIVMGECGTFGFGKSVEYIIPWDKIKCIGDDTILVRLDSEDLQCCKRDHRKRKLSKDKM